MGAAGVLLMLGGCAGTKPGQGGTTGGEMIRLEGVAVYRERMALPADAVLEVTVEDVSRADAPAEALARSSTAAGNAPPIAFVVTYPAAALQAGHRYAVRARILHQGRLLFITDTHHALPPPDSAVPLQLPLVRTGSAPASTATLENTYWKLLRLGDTEIASRGGQRELHLILQAPPDGPKRVAGFAGCNRIVGSYTLDGEQLVFSRLAGTLMACREESGRIETTFHEALQQARRWAIRGEQLDLFDAAGKRVALFESRYLE